METAQVNRLMVEIHRLKEMTDGVTGLLEAQNKVLQMRGMGLPNGFLEQLGNVQGNIDDLLGGLNEQQPELTQLRAVVRTMAAISAKLDLDSVLNDVMDTFVDLTEAERGFIVLRDPETREMEFKVARGMDQSTLSKGSFKISSTIVEDVATKGEAVITTNAQEDARYSAQQSIVSYAVRSIICVPLKLMDEIIGVAYADHRFRQELFGDKELQSLGAFADQAAIAIENARLYASVQEQLAEITEIRNFLDSIFNSIASGVVTLDSDGIVMTMNRAAEEILGVSAEDSPGRDYTEVFPALYEGFDETLNAVRSEGHQQTLDINPILPERGPVNLNLKLSPLQASEGVLGVAIVIDDLTELKQRDETLRVVNTYLSEEMVANIHNIDSLGLGGESRTVSAIFADVRGFTTFSENLDPETLMSVINRYLTVSSEAVQIAEGIIDKFMGDAVLGLFNTQLNPQQDHAERCVRAGMMIVMDVENLHESLPKDQCLFYGVGIHTGAATLGNVGSPSRKEFTAIGEAVVYSKKLQEIAQGGEIIISKETYEQVKKVIECEAVERELRDGSAVVKAYKVVKLKD